MRLGWHGVQSGWAFSKLRRCPTSRTLASHIVLGRAESHQQLLDCCLAPPVSMLRPSTFLVIPKVYAALSAAAAVGITSWKIQRSGHSNHSHVFVVQVASVGTAQIWSSAWGAWNEMDPDDRVRLNSGRLALLTNAELAITFQANHSVVADGWSNKMAVLSRLDQDLM